MSTQETQGAEGARRDAFLDEIAQKAAWCLENGASGENADIFHNILEYRAAFRAQPAPSGTNFARGMCARHGKITDECRHDEMHCTECGGSLAEHVPNGCRQPAPTREAASVSDSAWKASELGPEDFEPHELWFNGDELYRFTREYATNRISFGSDGEWPETLAALAPLGWSRWEGERRTLTAEDLAVDEEFRPPYGRLGVGDEWWEGSLRPATPAEVLAFFGLANRQPAPGETEPRGIPNGWADAVPEIIKAAHLSDQWGERSAAVFAILERLHASAPAPQRDSIAGALTPNSSPGLATSDD